MAKDSSENKRKAYMRYVLDYLGRNMSIMQERGLLSMAQLNQSSANFKSFVVVPSNIKAGRAREYVDNVAKKFYSAFNMEQTPMPPTIAQIHQSFKIPLDFGQFQLQLDNQNPEYIKYLPETVESKIEKDKDKSNTNPHIDEKADLGTKENAKELKQETKISTASDNPLMVLFAGCMSIFGLLIGISYMIYLINGNSGEDTQNVIKESQINHSQISQYINSPTINIIRNINVYGNFVVTKIDSSTGNFTARDKDMTFSVKRQGKYGEDISIHFSYGYSTEFGISRFPNGEYRTDESDKAILVFINAINNQLKNDYNSTSQIYGFINGFADATDIVNGTKYYGDLGIIAGQKYYVRKLNTDKYILKKFFKSANIDDLENVDFAFLRAYNFKKFLIDKLHQTMNPDRIAIHTTCTTEKNSAHRKVEAVIYFTGALSQKIKELNAETQIEISKLYQ